jgi:hypothetical protein
LKTVLVPVLAVSALALGSTPAAAQACGAHVSVRQVDKKQNEDGTRTLKYRAVVQADPAAGCTRVSFHVIRSYVRNDGVTLEEPIPMSVEAHDQEVVEAEDVLATNKLVYWRADRVSCQPCAGVAVAAKPSKPGKAARSGSGTKVAGEPVAAGRTDPGSGTKRLR